MNNLLDNKVRFTDFTQAKKEHRWITVNHPTRHTAVLQACDRCGVVKSENSVLKSCTGDANARLISSVYIAAYSEAV